MRHLFSPTALLAALVLTLGGCAQPREGNGRPVILITLDTTRSDYFGCYGRAGDPTPHFDALAEDGVRFAMALSTAAVTPVSHASILSGLYQYEHGLRVLVASGGFRIRRDVPTLATTLKDAGYTTAAVHSAFPVSAFFGFDAGFDIFESFDVELQTRGQNVGWDTTGAQRRSDETTDLALEIIDSAEQPLFLWVHYWDPHDTLMVPPDEFIPEDAPRIAEGYLVSTQIYQAEISYVDSQFGRLIAELKQRGLYEECVIAVVADHGEGLEDGKERHDWAMHRELYQEQIHVPMIVRAPDLPRGAVVDSVVSTVDLYPTLLECVGLDPPLPVSGSSLRELADGRASPARIVYADQVNFFDDNASMLTRRPHADFIHTVSDGKWKLIYRPTHVSQSELFHLAVDPEERDNLFAKASAAAERLRLLKDLARRAPWVLEPFPAIEGVGTEAASKALGALGYVESADEEPAAIEWRWRCPEHEERFSVPGDCEHCGTPRVPLGSYVE